MKHRVVFSLGEKTCEIQWNLTQAYRGNPARGHMYKSSDDTLSIWMLMTDCCSSVVEIAPVVGRRSRCSTCFLQGVDLSMPGFVSVLLFVSMWLTGDVFFPIPDQNDGDRSEMSPWYDLLTVVMPQVDLAHSWGGVVRLALLELPCVSLLEWTFFAECEKTIHPKTKMTENEHRRVEFSELCLGGG